MQEKQKKGKKEEDGGTRTKSAEPRKKRRTERKTKRKNKKRWKRTDGERR